LVYRRRASLPTAAISPIIDKSSTKSSHAGAIRLTIDMKAAALSATLRMRTRNQSMAATQ